MITDTALAGTAHLIVQDAIAGEGPHGAVFGLDRKFDDDGTMRTLEVVDQPPLEMWHKSNGAIELLRGDMERIEVFRSRGRGHRFAFRRVNHRFVSVSIL